MYGISTGFRSYSRLTAIFLRLGKYTRTTAVKYSSDFSIVLQVNDQRRSKEMISWPQGAIRVSMIHVRQPLAHVVAREHGHFFDSERQEDILL